jgi:hypothetical protein
VSGRNAASLRAIPIQSPPLAENFFETQHISRKTRYSGHHLKSNSNNMETVRYKHIVLFRVVCAHESQRQVSIRKELTRNLIALQEATPEHPYSIPHRLKLAKAYKQLGYPDLAASDAYKALLLIDEVVEEGEYYEEVLEAMRDDWITEKIADLSIKEQNDRSSGDDEEAMKWAQTDCSKTAYASNLSIKFQGTSTF